MMALAFPGKCQRLDPVPLGIDPSDAHYILLPFLSLLDLETRFYVYAHDSLQQETVTRYIEVNTRSRPAGPEQANFILCLEPSLSGTFALLKKGTLSHPHHSATVFYRVDEIFNPPENQGLRMSLTGPGIQKLVSLSVTGLAAEEVEQWRTEKSDYPMGIDIYLVSRTGRLIGIPRSVAIDLSGGS